MLILKDLIIVLSKTQFTVSVSLTRLARTMHNICKVRGFRTPDTMKKKTQTPNNKKKLNLQKKTLKKNFECRKIEFCFIKFKLMINKIEFRFIKIIITITTKLYHIK